MDCLCAHSTRACSSGEGLLSDDALQARCKAEEAWAQFQTAGGPRIGQPVLWANEWSGKLPCILSAYAAGAVSALDCQRMLAMYATGADACIECQCGDGRVAAMHRELHIWHASWQRNGSRRTVIDFNNAFGWHALPVDDPAWCSEAFCAKWMAIAKSGCRGTSDGLPVANGPLDPTSELAATASRLTPEGFELISVAGSGTEAIQSFYDIANAYLTALLGTTVTDSNLLFFRGCYVGGAHSLQGANGISFIARQAFAPSGVSDECLLDGAPYSRAALKDLDRLLETVLCEQTDCHSSEVGAVAIDVSSADAALDDAEAVCLRGVKVRLDSLQAKGVHVGGVVVEVVSSHGVRALRPAFLAALKATLHSRRLLLFEDAVMTGLRCGAAFLGAACSAMHPDFVAIGKAWGFSGVLAHTTSTSNVAWRRPPPYLNGYLTMRMSRADLLRAVTILDAVLQRSLMRNALLSGRRLVRCLRAQGLDVWGLGLLVGFSGDGDGEHETSGDDSDGDARASGARLLNATAAFSRLLPPLTLGERPDDWTYLSTSVVGGEETAKRVAERVLWWRVETEQRLQRQAAEGALMLLQPTDYLQMLECALSSGALTPYASILSPMLRARLPPAESSNTPEGRLELISSLWADVLGM